MLKRQEFKTEVGIEAHGEAPAQQDAMASVFTFWNTEPCGTHLVSDTPGTPEFFAHYRQFRYRTEWHIPRLVPFADTRGKKVLEIGCGNGADGTVFALAGADYTGVDLTEAAVRATGEHFRSLGIRGNFGIENAECLSFPDESFDFVYSYGVLHHTANPGKAFSEVHRVLKTGGKAVLMVYHKHSFNYYVRILLYMRLRLLLRILQNQGRLSTHRRRSATRLSGVRGNEHSSVWEIHYENFLREGWSYLRAKSFVHHATDGPECPFAYVYTCGEVQRIFKDFAKVRTVVAHFPLRKYSLGSRVPLWLEKALACSLGWYLFVYLTK